MNEPKVVAPITLFGNRPAIGSRMVDFRPQPVAANDAMPQRGDIKELMEEAPDPKADSSVTVDAISFASGSVETTSPLQKIIQSHVVVSPASVETVTPPMTPMTTPGSNEPPVGPTGQTVLPARPQIGTPSSPDADKQ